MTYLGDVDEEVDEIPEEEPENPESGGDFDSGLTFFGSEPEPMTDEPVETEQTEAAQ